MKTIHINQTKGIFISDIHFGVRSSSEEWQYNIKDYFYNWFIPYLKKLKNKKDYVIYCLGDIFDDRKSINIEVNDLAITIFSDIANILPIFIINGNHDLYKKTNKGTTSLKSLENIPNITLIMEPTILNIGSEEKSINILAIPYLGDLSLEGNYLIKNKKNIKYAFMHTDISKMKYDNGQEITAGVNVDLFKGKIFSGHIHTRQENGNVLYVGSPYQTKRSDIGNIKGIYDIDFLNGKLNFTENNYSPIFQKINIDIFLSMNDEDRNKLINNNYNDILIPEKDLHKYKLNSLYEIINKSAAKRITISVIKSDQNLFTDNIENFKELTLEELIDKSIDSLDNQDIDKNHLKLLSKNYLKAAEAELSATF